MMKKVILFTLSALICSPLGFAKSSKLLPVKEQTEDMRYYQQFDWNTTVDRSALYHAKANGQFHMYEKMMTCQTQVSDLEGWFIAFKTDTEEVANREAYFDMRDMDDNLLKDDDDGNLVALWLTRDFAEKHYKRLTDKNLTELKGQYWAHCLAELPVKLFTIAAQDKLDAKKQAKEIEQQGYSHDETW